MYTQLKVVFTMAKFVGKSSVVLRKKMPALLTLAVQIISICVVSLKVAKVTKESNIAS